jgi:glutamyl-Q tRNA(Asp) synthetase
MTVGRFAPSPTGPLHFGSLVAAVGSWLFARTDGGRWLVRIEDIDTPRVVPGSAEEILAALRRYGLEWDGAVVWQSKRTHLYDAALTVLGAKGLTYECGCSRADVQRAASAQHEQEPVYPGTCRNGLEGRVARSIRFRAPEEPENFTDLIRGPIFQSCGGDFIIKRADGLYAYQLAVVVDDAEQGITQVIRGGDLIGSTARQIALQKALGVPHPEYGHLPLVVDVEGLKIGKRDGALPLPALDPKRLLSTLGDALNVLGVPSEGDSPVKMLLSALTNFDRSRLTGRTTVVHNPKKQR